VGKKYMTYISEESHQKKLKLSLKHIHHQLRHSQPQGKVSPYIIQKWIHVHKKEKLYNGTLYLSDVMMTTLSPHQSAPLRTSCEPPEKL